MANMSIQTKDAANGYILDVTFYPGDTAQNGDWDAYDRGTRSRSYIAKDKDELKALITELLENNIDAS